MNLAVLSTLLAALVAQPAEAARGEDAASSLQMRVEAAVHDAESMALRSGQPSQSVVLEIAKAVRSVVWTSGAAPSLVVSSLRAVEMSGPMSAQALQAIKIVEHEMSE